MARGEKNKGDNKINGQLKSVLQKRLDEISNLSSLDLNGLYSLSQEYLSDVKIQLGPNSPVRSFSLSTIKSDYPHAFPQRRGYNAFIEKAHNITQLIKQAEQLKERLHKVESLLRQKSLFSITKQQLLDAIALLKEPINVNESTVIAIEECRFKPAGYDEMRLELDKKLFAMEEELLIDEIKEMLAERMEHFEQPSVDKNLNSLIAVGAPLVIRGKEYTIEEAVEKIGLTAWEKRRQILKKQIDSVKEKEIKAIMETRLKSLNNEGNEGLFDLEQRRKILSQSIMLSNGEKVSFVEANFFDKDLQKRYREEQHRVDIKIATLDSFDKAIETILSSFGEKISSIGTHRPKAKEDAIMLHKSLGEMKTQVLKGNLTPKDFKVQSQRKIEEALPEFKADVDLFTYLKNIMKKIASLTIGGFIPSHYQGFFKTKESEAYTGAKSLKEGIVSNIGENEVDNRKDDTQIKP
ncbi:MAG: hypothetical protein CK426_04590 [Legionella sp.]|nr:MAG: hypothetical protein CK423_09320 [Legionella sp.]PJD98852.1 MAG: hypothetical protein CK426_04590 [Legionella sp.]